MAKQVFRLKAPKNFEMKNGMLVYYYENVIIKDGIATCTMKQTRDDLVRIGWQEISGKKVDEKAEGKKAKKGGKGKN